MIHFELVTLSGVKHREKVHEVMLPTLDGQIAVFEHHAPLVSVAVPGEIIIRRAANHPDDMLEHFAISGGVIEITDNKIRVLVDEADHAKEIDEKQAQKAYEHAQELLKEAKDKVSLDRAQSLLDRQAVRIKVATTRRHKYRGADFRPPNGAPGR
jgi:F-type H+-transporting ATPase subunit epsilon